MEDHILADRAYDCNRFRDELRSHCITPVISGKNNHIQKIECDVHIYKERNIIERFFNRLKNFICIAARYDKTAVMYLVALIVASTLLWLK